ncbi:MAG: hypothetical protein PHR56_04005 [Dehalococcoidales bacterium]|nr:hypothetical protein [Dehalococcoidales bacterium]
MQNIKTQEHQDSMRKRYIIIIAAFIVALFVIAGGFYYQQYVAPFHRTILTVDGNEIKMDYFLTRARLSGIDSLSLVQPIIEEQIVKQEALRYVGTITAEDIDKALRRTAQGGGTSLTESEFQEWYRQQLNDTQMSDAEFRDMVSTSILTERFNKYLSERVSTVAEQIHLHAILVDTAEKATEVQGYRELAGTTGIPGAGLLYVPQYQGQERNSSRGNDALPACLSLRVGNHIEWTGR